jgi:hypothetical protein
MAHSLTLINKSTDTFDVWVNLTNQMANVVMQEALTANNNANGAYVTGNSFLFGTFGANTVAVYTALRGGNVQSTATLLVTSNVWANDVSYNISVGNTTVNTTSNATTFVAANGLINSTLTYNSMKVGANVVANLTSLSISNSIVSTVIGNSAVNLGNSTVNSTVNSTGLFVGTSVVNSSLVALGSNVTLDTVKLNFGNTTVNATLNSTALVMGVVASNQTTLSVGNSTVNVIANASTITVGANVSLNTSILFIGNSSVNVVANSSSVSISGNPLVANNAKESVAWENTLVGTRGRINFIAGNNVFLNVTDDSADGQVNVQINAVSTSGAAIIGGTNSAIQFNSNMNFGGDASKLAFDTVNAILTCSNTVVSNVVQLSQSVILAANVKSFVASVGPDTVEAINKTAYRSAEYLYSVKNNGANGYQTGKLIILNDDTNAGLEEYAVSYSNALMGTFSSSSNTTHILVQFTPVSSLSYTITSSKTCLPI